MFAIGKQGIISIGVQETTFL